MDPNPQSSIRYGHIDPDYAVRLATTPPDEDGPIWMINLMKYREVADYADGRSTGISGREADDLYAPFESLAEVGAEIVFVGDVDTQLLGDAPKWDRVGVVEYPSRRAFLAMQELESFERQHVHKDAGMEQTIIMAGRPIDWPAVPADAPDWAEVPHPPSDDDGYVHVLHVLRFHDGGADTDMVRYQGTAGEVAVPHGVRIGAWFGIEGTIVGDGRAWDQARFNIFPSRAAFMAVALDPDRLAAQAEHREVAIADTYTMILRPFIDRLNESATREPG
jgi:hypothetical protein